MNRRNLYGLIAAVAMMAFPAGAGVIFEAGTVTVAQGSTGTIEVDLVNTGLSGLTIGGFNFEIAADSDIDFTGAGFDTSAPYIFAGDSFDQDFPASLNTSTGSSLSAGDISNSGNGDPLGAGDTAGLALVTFDVSPTAALGPVTVSFATDSADSNLSDQNGDSIPIDSFVNGTIDITSAAPEPSSAAMLLFCTIGLLACRRRLKTGAFRLAPILSLGRMLKE